MLLCTQTGDKGCQCTSYVKHRQRKQQMQEPEDGNEFSKAER